MAGLLHDFGKVVIAYAMPTLFCKALEMSHGSARSLHQTINEVVGVDDAVVGALLIDKWRFPDNLVQTIRYQNQPHLCDTPLMACLLAAIHVSQYQGFGFGSQSAQNTALPDCVARRLGGNLSDIMHNLGDLTDILAEVRRDAHPTHAEETIS